MLYFKAKMHQIRFQPGPSIQHHQESSQHSPDPLVGFSCPTSKRKRDEGVKRESGKEQEEKGNGRREQGRKKGSKRE